MSSKNEIISVENNLTKQDFRQIFWRSFTLRIFPIMKEWKDWVSYMQSCRHSKIYKDDEVAYKVKIASSYGKI